MDQTPRQESARRKAGSIYLNLIIEGIEDEFKCLSNAKTLKTSEREFIS